MTRAGRAPAQQARRLSKAFAAAAERQAGNEQAFRAEAEAALEATAQACEVELDTRRELTLARGRADAVFNRYVIEWEAPGRLALGGGGGNRHAVTQLRDYIDQLADQERRRRDRLAGIACDGRVMIFARYRDDAWLVDEPVEVDERSAGQLLDGLISAQTGRALTAEGLDRAFGGRTALARQLSRALLDQLDAELGHRPGGPAALLYRQWEGAFAVATGVLGEATQLNPGARRELARMLGRTERSLDPARGLFAVQTYFAILTKLVASLALSLWVPRAEWNIEELAVGGDEDLLEDMEWLEDGGPFTKVGLLNVIERDVFSWYLDWTPTVRDRVRNVIELLQEFDAATLEVSPEDARDLLKGLYQRLLPRSVRHALGQYFTPDWLAAQVLDGVRYSGDPATRLLDPACGTGTFLVLAITRLRDRLRRDRIPDRQALEVVLRNVMGFDLDPLAVVAARTNYVLALGPLIAAARADPVDIPVYLSDSIVTPSLGETLYSGDRLRLPTAAGVFELPSAIDNADKLRVACDLAAEVLRDGGGAGEFVRRAARRCDVPRTQEPILDEFYTRCFEQGFRTMTLWPQLLRNSFMPAFVKPVELIVGNPPWVNWESLPASYRDRTRSLWERSGLFVHGGMAAMLGAGKKDISMLMSLVTSDRLLVNGGRLGFVITQTVFKTAGAGQGFRRFRLPEGRGQLKVERVDDMVDLNPFSGAQNRTALLFWRRDSPTRYPIRYVLWQRTAGRSLSTFAKAQLVDRYTRRLELAAAPVRDDDRTSAWLTAPSELVPSLRKLAARTNPTYVAHAGVFSGGANGVYWLSVDGPPDQHGLLPVTNLHNVGDRRVERRYGRVETELVHQLVRGSDVSRWSVSPSAHILFVQDPAARRGIDPDTMASQYPGALAFLSLFEHELRGRAAFRRYYTRVDRATGHRIETGPFWSMFDVGSYTLAEHKVVWKDQAAIFTAAVLSANDPLPLPNHKVMMVACASADEAHYLCALLNSLPVRVFVRCYALELQISTHTVKNIEIPMYDPKQDSHRALVRASGAAHDAVAVGREPDEAFVDTSACAVWGITEDELEAMRAFHARLMKEDLARA